MSRKTLITTFLCFFIAFFVFCLNSYSESIRLAITYSDSLKSTMRTMRGIKSTISKRFEKAVFEEFLLTSDINHNNTQINKIKEINPKLILTLGSYTTEIVSEQISNKSIIFSAVLNPETSGFVKSLAKPGGNLTGASLDIPPDIQFKYFKQVIKNLKSIGVMYTSETKNLIPPAKALAKEAGLELHTVEITSEKEIPKALDSLNRVADGLWSVADFNIYSPHFTRFILLNTLRNGKPFMGFSKNLVESGALFALEYDYKDIGRQTGKIANEVLSGKPPSAIPVTVPRIIWFHYNEKTAKHINIEIPEDLVAVAKEVYK